MTANPKPSGAEHEFGAGKRGRLRITKEEGDNFAERAFEESVGVFEAYGEGHNPAICHIPCRARKLSRSLGATSPA
jgi:hypothetical protein